MPHGGDPEDSTAFCVVVPIDNGCFATTPTTGYKNGTIYTAPKTDGRQVKIRSVVCCAYTSPIDATDDVTVVLKTVTATGSAKATLNTGVSIKSANVADKTSVEIYNGAALLLPGESLEYEVTVTTPDTAGFGVSLSAELDLLKA